MSKDHKEIFSRLRQLLNIEKEEGLQQYQKQVVLTPIKQRRDKGLTWYPVKINHQEIGAGENYYLSIEREAALNQNHAFQVGDSVALFHQSSQNSKVSQISGVIAGLWKNNMRVAFNVDELPDWVDYEPLGLNLLFDTGSFKEMEDTLLKVEEAQGDRLAELRDLFLLKGEAQERDLGEFSYALPLPQLNDSQNEALKKVLKAKDIAIVHGPPGTGKTTTLVEAIHLSSKHEKQLLVCVPSNTAVDLLAFRLLEKGLKILRIGNPARFEEELSPFSLDGQIALHPDFRTLKKLRKDSAELHRMAGKYKRNFGKEEREQRRLLYTEANRLKHDALSLEKYIVDDLLNQAQVICATLVGSVNRYIRYRKFSTIFMDEAAQALEPAAWIPIRKAERVILAGDHFQLPPTVKSYEASQGGLSETLFEKIIQGIPSSAALLRTQYRMHEQIMNFSNQQFYEGELLAHPSVAQHTLLEGVSESTLNQALEFIDTAGCGFEEKRHSETLSRYNPEEAQILIKHLRNVIEQITHSPLKPEEYPSIGIISPYQAQVEYIRNEIQENEFIPPEISLSIQTVDGFQGQEKDIIYISLVRSNEKGQIGFLSDVRRMNVALTRARKKLVAIGDTATLAQHSFYDDFLRYSEASNAYHSAWEWMHT